MPKMTHKTFAKLVEESVETVGPVQEVQMGNGRLFTRFPIYKDQCYSIFLGFTHQNGVVVSVSSLHHHETLNSKRVRELSEKLAGIAAVMERCGG